MTGSRSLMDFVDAPVLVGDPEGRAVYANPAFERDFKASKDSLTGVPLASLFETMERVSHRKRMQPRRRALKER